MRDTLSEFWVQRLLKLGFAVQRHLRHVGDSEIANFAKPIAHEAGDTIYGLDRHVEPIIEGEIDAWPIEAKPLLLIAEGMGADGKKLFGDERQPIRYRLIVDPIDGTRGLMYDKRSAWFLAAIAPEYGEQTTMADALASVLVELPVSKQIWADAFMAIAGQSARGIRRHVLTGEENILHVRPSSAETLKDGFGQVANFFPGTKILAAELMERIAAVTVGGLRPGCADVFDDQYISSGGQMVELIVGHDRFCCDLRPLFYEIIERQTGRTIRGVECHPYDLAGLLVARQAGVILTDGFGRSLNCPLDVHTGVHWCGYANATLHRRIEPVVLDWLTEKGLAVPR